MNKLFKHYKLIAKIMGIICFIGGGILVYLGFADLVKSLIKNVEPTLMACSIIGIIVLTISVVLMIIGYASQAVVYITEENIKSDEKVRHRVEYINESVSDVDVAAPIICPICGVVNDSDSRFCKGCGNKL